MKQNTINKMSKLVLLLLCLLISLTSCSKDSAKDSQTESDSEISLSTIQLEKIVEELPDFSDNSEPAKMDSDDKDTVEKKYYIDTYDFLVKPLDKEDTQQLALLTIDDAPQPEEYCYSLEMAKTLKSYDVGAIFFVNGMYLETEFGRNVVKELDQMGFEIGNHTYTHHNLSELDYEGTYREIVNTNDIVEEITGKRPKFFRPGFGVVGDYGLQIAEQENMIWMNWTYGYDWEEGFMEAEPLAEIMVNNDMQSNGSNILMHDRKWSSEALPAIIEGLRAKGFYLVHPDELATDY